MVFPYDDAGRKPGGAERREAVRRTLRAPALVLLPGQPGRVGRTVDVSEGGVCVLLAEALPPGTQCLVGFELPEGSGARKRVQSKARVVLSVLSNAGDGFRIGMQFFETPPETKRALEIFIRE